MEVLPVRIAAAQVSRIAIPYGTLVVGAVLAAIVVRLACAAVAPLASDEALYWRYSLHLAPGFLDHPFVNPLLIRIGTTMLGDTSLGVRFMAIVSTLPATWAVWRAGAILFPGARIGPTAAALFNLTIAISMGSMMATSDQAVVVASSFLLFALAKIHAGGAGHWWLAAGAAFGIGMCSKYTTLFFAPGILVWIAMAPERRTWLRSPWIWAGGLLALAVFSPVLMWNAEHRWVSFTYQSSRMVVHAWTFRYVLDLIGSQLLLATPPIFVLACVGLFWNLRGSQRDGASRLLLVALVVPLSIYFIWHALHQRVQGNWTEAVYPALAVAAAWAVHNAADSPGAVAAWVRWSRRLAAPVGVMAALFIYAHIVIGPFPLGKRARETLGWGWEELAPKIDAARARIGAPMFVATDYHVTAWLYYYLRTRTPVEQVNERIRWANEPAPAPALFTGPVAYVCREPCPHVGELSSRFGDIRRVETMARNYHGAEIDRYSVYSLSQPLAPPLNPLYRISRPGLL